MGKTIVFIHGAWMTPLCWEPFNSFFAAKGYTCMSPAWPYRDASVETLRENPPPELARLGVSEIVDHYAKIIQAQAERPILIGHSFGGLFVQLLLDRGLGAAGVAIDPAPPQGVLPVQWSALRSSMGVLTKWRSWEHIVTMSLPEFQYGFVNTLSPAEQKAAYDKHVVPETGRIFFQAALSLLDRRSPVRVNFFNPTRAPLLMTAGVMDHTVPLGMVRSNFAKYYGAANRTELKEFPGRSHWIIVQDGWEEVAGYIANWLERLPTRKT